MHLNIQLMTPISSSLLSTYDMLDTHVSAGIKQLDKVDRISVLIENIF